MPKQLTDRQLEILAFLRERIGQGETPTIRAIADEFEIGVNAVVGHLARLREKGAIEWIRDGRAAGVRLAGKRCCKCGGTGVLL